MYLISLIIPVYNAEEFLDNTINSIINQSIGFKNIEIQKYIWRYIIN